MAAFNINKFVNDYEALKNNFEDLKTIILSIPMDKLSIENINKIEDSLKNLKLSSKVFIESFEDGKNMYDFFKGGEESIGFCRKIGIKEDKFYEMKDVFTEIINFDIKKFVLEYKKG